MEIQLSSFDLMFVCLYESIKKCKLSKNDIEAKTISDTNHYISSISANMVAIHTNSIIAIYDVKTMHLVKKIKHNAKQTSNICLSTNGKFLAAASDDKHINTNKTINRDLSIKSLGDHTLTIWDVETGDKMLVVDMQEAIYTLAFSNDCSKILTVGTNQQIKIWDTETGKLNIIFPKHNAPIFCACFSPDDELIAFATAGNKKEIHILEVSREANSKTIHFSSTDVPIYSLCFSQDGKQLFCGMDKGRISISNIYCHDNDESVQKYELTVSTSPVLNVVCV